MALSSILSKMFQRQEVGWLDLCRRSRQPSHFSPGQNCIWSAGLVMARYLECSDLRSRLLNQRILELGAGAGLTSMVAALLGGDVYSTEQKSCLGYLQVRSAWIYLSVCLSDDSHTLSLL
jgi:hypothetical protein